MARRIWLDVPLRQKDEAKAIGARWDPQAGRWYAPRPGMVGLEPWAALPDVPSLLPGEDRAFGSGLFVDLVPQTCWFTNVRSCVDERDWERLRRMINGRAGQRCEICGAAKDQGRRRWLEAHERWAYDVTSRTQTLRRLICLCTECHRATHFGFAEVQGNRDAAMAHLMKVTGMARAAGERHVQEAFAVWLQRSSQPWALDLSMLTHAGITVTAPPSPAARATASDKGLAAGGPVKAPSAAPPPQPERVPTSPPVLFSTSAARPAPSPPSPDQVRAALDSAFPHPMDGHRRWVTIPPWPWFCQMCDSDMHSPHVALATVQQARWRRWEIICQPVEWRHILDDLRSPNGLRLLPWRDGRRRAVDTAVAQALAAPGVAVSWDAAHGRFDVVTGTHVRWQDARGRR